MDAKKIQEEISAKYGAIAKSGSGTDGSAMKIAKAFGYTDEDLAKVPEGANLGLGCGNPVALANVREGETIVDLGCGGGIDVLSAAHKVGPNGVAIGIDMNKDMLQRASTNAAKVGITNVRFIECPVTKLTLRDGAADCIVSNCVINLVPSEEKQLAFDEMYRVLKPGGRVAISDILARKQFPESMAKSIALHVGCMAGASQVSEYETYLANSGFEDIRIVDSKSDLNTYMAVAQEGKGCCDTSETPETTSQCCQPAEADSDKCCVPEKKEGCCPDKEGCCEGEPGTSESGISKLAKEMARDMGDVDWNEWVGSFQVYALKPNAEE